MLKHFKTKMSTGMIEVSSAIETLEICRYFQWRWPLLLLEEMGKTLTHIFFQVFLENTL